MSNIELRSWNIPISDPLREHVERRLDFALRRFAQYVQRITVRLVDINGPKGGPDKRCRIVVELLPAQTLIVEALDSDAYAAVSQAAIRMDEKVARVLTRRRPRPPDARRGGARRARERAYLTVQMGGPLQANGGGPS